ncbi:transposase family protein [uncultured Aminobacterium sp.]|jgi:hypothetical protein|uniref:transposase family protein n=1 Tax=uncultured Aminobacterium sp. TaxID=548265 RepID=UPI002598AC17|nr:transposase family protein [uncultured Aminobacterium sp.]
MSNKRRLQRQKERDIKLFEDIVSGRARLACSIEKPKKRALPNKISSEGTEEQQQMLGQLARVYRCIFSGLIWKLGEVKDPRSPRNQSHSLLVLLLHAILMFAFHVESRRTANDVLAGMGAIGILQAVFPEMKTMPHADTVANMLEDIHAEEIQDAYIKMFREHINSPGFRDKYADGPLLVAVDGSQSFVRDYRWDKQALCRHVGEQKKEQFYTSYLEAVLVLKNGAILPVYTEVIENDGEIDGDKKQDCETKAFYRMAEKLHSIFGRGGLTLVADGLYASGPIVSICNKYHWGYMLSLKDGDMSSVWEDAEGLMKAEPSNLVDLQWGERVQSIRWANGVEYTYGKNHTRLQLNLVVCHEMWVEPYKRSKKETKRMFTRYAWLSSERITSQNAFHLCTEVARRRWMIESSFNTEKNGGYSFEHCFSYNWNAMKAYHYLMKFARFFNTLVAYSGLIADYTRKKGFRGLVRSFKTALCNGKIDGAQIRAMAEKKTTRWKMVTENIFLVAATP